MPRSFSSRSCPTRPWRASASCSRAPSRAAELYLVEASGTTKQVEIDPANYVGSAANVVGGKPQTIQIQLEINDFKTEDKEFKARTHLKTMNQAFLALVVKQGQVRFRRAVLTTEPPTSP